MTAVTDAAGRAVPGTRYAFGVVHPGSPMLRIRYRSGIAVGPHGFPDWVPYARAMVQLPPLRLELSAQQARVVDVLTANAVRAGQQDPLWTDVEPLATPAGWTWAILSSTRRAALVPIELHGAYRHLGGVSTGSAAQPPGGLPAGGSPPKIRFERRLSAEALRAVEVKLGVELPSGYRQFLARTNGGQPSPAAVHPDHGFVADQPFFGLARADWLQDLAYANGWFDDRLTADWLAIGYVQGGLLAVRVRGEDAGSVWYCDDDDPRDDDSYTAVEVCARLLHRCAGSFEDFWYALRPVPQALRALAVEAAGAAAPIRPDGMGQALPAPRRPPSPVARS